MSDNPALLFVCLVAFFLGGVVEEDVVFTVERTTFG